MTQDTAPQIATSEDVAKRMGIDPEKLPKGFATVESVKKSRWENYTTYTWSDAAGTKQAEVKINEDEDNALSYTKSIFNQNGVINYQCKRHKDGRLSHLYYHDNGVLAEANHATTFGYTNARLHEFFDKDGKLHNLDGLASYYSCDGTAYDKKYAIHGAEYSWSGYNANPERMAFKKENGWLAKIGRAISGLTNSTHEEKTPYTEPAVPAVETLIAAAQGLSSSDKLRLMESLGGEFKNAAAVKTNKPVKIRTQAAKGPKLGGAAV